MKFRKNNKKLAIILGASALSLGTIGFASWIINEQVKIEKQDVAVSFGDVQDTSVVAILDTNNSDLVLSFDALQDDVGKITASTNNEDLSFHFKFTIKVGSKVNLTGVKFDINPDPFANLVTGGYITKAYATTQTVTLDSEAAGTYIPNDDFTQYTKDDAANKAQSHVVTYESGTRTYTFVSTFNFKWGEKFNNTNPSKADDVVGGTYNADQIITNLNAFKAAYGATTGQKVGVTITPVTSNAN